MTERFPPGIECRPRGLAAAVLATFQITLGLPHAEAYPQIVFFIIMSSVIITTIGLGKAKRISVPVSFGGQDCSAEEKGAFTGEVSTSMLKEMGATHVLVGHSERRQRGGETNESLNQKLKQAV